MPTSKRQKRAVDQDEKEGGGAIEEAGVAYDKENKMNGEGGGGGKRGRGRKSSHDDEGGNDDDEDDEYEEDEQQQRPQASPSRKRAKAKNGGVVADASSPLRDRHLNPKGAPAEAGIIHEVYVENFMCHRKLSVKLCRNVNFIHGQNGSGKSAVLAAIQVCLGAGARRTHRARNLRDLVRKEAGADCPGARLRVTLLNGGADGYMPDVYGEYITVERLISLRPGGFNGYKLLDSSMKERSRSKKDLDAMLDQLNIQVENPVAVLDQEEAKKFLTGKEEDKYAFFVKATELERLDRAYASVQDNILEQQALQERAREGVGGAIENTRRLKKEWEQFRELDKLEMEAQELRAMYGWGCHREFIEQLNEEMKVRRDERGGRSRRIDAPAPSFFVGPGSPHFSRVFAVDLNNSRYRNPKKSAGRSRSNASSSSRPSSPWMSPTTRRRNSRGKWRTSARRPTRRRSRRCDSRTTSGRLRSPSRRRSASAAFWRGNWRRRRRSAIRRCGGSIRRGGRYSRVGGTSPRRNGPGRAR